MRNRTKLIVAVFALVCISISVATWLWTPSFQREHVDVAIVELALPLRAVKTECFLDGGSIGLTLTDANGVTLKCALPVDNQTAPPSWPKVFIGAVHVARSNEQATTAVREVEHPVETKAYLMELLDKYGSGDDERILVLLELRGAPRDKLRAFSN
jgi:hypothetical protein